MCQVTDGATDLRIIVGHNAEDRVLGPIRNSIRLGRDLNGRPEIYDVGDAELLQIGDLIVVER